MKKILSIFLLCFLLTSIYAQRDRVQIKDETLVTDKGILLRGAFISPDVTSTPPDRKYIDALKGFGLNTLHVYGECPEFNTPGLKMAMIDSLVKWTCEDSLYLILTIGGGWTLNGQFDSAFVMDFWNIYAPRYKDETHVVYEICNEPYSWEAPYDEETLAMERWAYDTIRALAPDTHIQFMSYSGARNADSVISDIEKLGPGIDWDNASIACHGYGAASENLRNYMRTIQNAGYAIMNTEPASIGNEVVNLASTRVFEEEFISYAHFVSVASMYHSAGVFADPIESSEVRWESDFNGWPATLTNIQFRNPYEEFDAGFYDEGRGFDLLHLDTRIGYINDGDYIAYYNFNFTESPDSVVFKASCNNESKGSIYMYLDSLEGTLIGIYPIQYTGDWDNYQTISFAINNSITGVHKFYLEFHSNQQYDFLNLESIRFKHNTPVLSVITPFENSRKPWVYPNPANTDIIIQSAENGVLGIFSLQGQLLLSEKINTGKQHISISQLGTGSYVIRFNTPHGVLSKKLIVQ